MHVTAALERLGAAEDAMEDGGAAGGPVMASSQQVTQLAPVDLHSSTSQPAPKPLRSAPELPPETSLVESWEDLCGDDAFACYEPGLEGQRRDAAKEKVDLIPPSTAGLNVPTSLPAPVAPTSAPRPDAQWDAALCEAQARRSTASDGVGGARRRLPAFAAREDVVAVIRRHSVILVKGETGSGKTTQVR